MSSAQATYLVAIGLYLVFFFLFIRFFLWKAYADRKYWNNRLPLSIEKVAEIAEKAGRLFPKISVVIPARNESPVIRRTLEHMFSLRYPADRWEIVVATDEKEAAAAAAARPRLVRELQEYLERRLLGKASGAHEATVALRGTATRALEARSRESERETGRIGESCEAASDLGLFRPTGKGVRPSGGYLHSFFFYLPRVFARFMAGNGACARDRLGMETRPKKSGHKGERANGSSISRDASRILQFLLASLSRKAWVATGHTYSSKTGRSALAADGGQNEPPLIEDDDRVIYEITAALVDLRGRCPIEKVRMLVERHLGSGDPKRLEEALPTYIAAAMPAAASYWALEAGPVVAGGRMVSPSMLVARMARSVARAHHDLTVEVVRAQTEVLSQTILGRLRRLASRGGLVVALEQAAARCFPTTQEIVEQVRAKAESEPRPALKHVVVPYDFDGKMEGICLGREVPSTKGRALNYALRFIDPDAELCGFYDAESRPHRDVLLYVALRRLTAQDSPPRVFQGPVFQVRNFFTISPFCRIASLYQAIAHEWYLPVLFHRLPFVGGTNLFVEKGLLFHAGGFHPGALTEDLELGCRLFLRTGAWPEYLPYPSSEQTPPTVRAFFRQRLRWGSGHLQVVSEVLRGYHDQPERRRALLRQLFLKGELEWVFYQLATLVPPFIAVLWAFNHVDASILPHQVGLVLHCMSLIYLGFTYHIYRRYGNFFDGWSRPRSVVRRMLVVIGLLLLPLAAFMFPLPYSSAIVLRAARRAPVGWVKTPRTQE